MIAIDNTGRYIVECHLPLNFVRKFPNWNRISAYDAYCKWRNSIHESNKPCCGKINNGEMNFSVESVGPLQSKDFQKIPATFEMFIRPFGQMPDIHDVLRGNYGKHFFVMNIALTDSSTPENIVVEKFLFPILMAENYPQYDIAMDNLFSEYQPMFNVSTDASQLPHTSLRY